MNLDPAVQGAVGRDEPLERVAELAKERPEAYVASAYDDPHVILGNSSLSKELAALKPMPEIVVAPVGGDGLSSGIIFGIEGARKKIQVIGAEPVPVHRVLEPLLTVLVACLMLLLVACLLGPGPRIPHDK